MTFVTGIANDLTMWDGQVAPLADDFRILRYDFRGHGGSEATAGDYTLPLLIADLLALWDALGVRQTHLVGLGLGGAMIQGLAADHPGRILKLMPCCCRADMTPDFAAMWPKFIEVVKQHGMEGMVEPTVQRWFTADFREANPDIIEGVRRMIRGTNPLGYYGVHRGVSDAAVRRPDRAHQGADALRQRRRRSSRRAAADHAGAGRYGAGRTARFGAQRRAYLQLAKSGRLQRRADRLPARLGYADRCRVLRLARRAGLL